MNFTQTRAAVLDRRQVDRLAGAVGVEESGRLPLLWHWLLRPPALSGAASSLLTRFIRPLAPDLPMRLVERVDRRADERVEDIVQADVVRMQTVLRPEPAGPGQWPTRPLARSDDVLLRSRVDGKELRQIFAEAGAVDPGQHAISVLAAERFRQRIGSSLAALRLNLLGDVEDLSVLRVSAVRDIDGRAQFRIGVPEGPLVLTGTAWFGCGPGYRS